VEMLKNSQSYLSIARFPPHQIYALKTNSGTWLSSCPLLNDTFPGCLLGSGLFWE